MYQDWRFKFTFSEYTVIVTNRFKVKKTNKYWFSSIFRCTSQREMEHTTGSMQSLDVQCMAISKNILEHYFSNSKNTN